MNSIRIHNSISLHPLLLLLLLDSPPPIPSRSWRPNRFARNITAVLAGTVGGPSVAASNHCRGVPHIGCKSTFLTNGATNTLGIARNFPALG